MKKAIFLTDIHYPYYDKKTIEIAKKVMKDSKPDYLILGGDNWDAEGISKFTAKYPEDGLIQTYEEMLNFKKLIFDPLKKLANETILMLGNHDGQRLIDYLNKAQQRGHNNLYNYWHRQFNFKKLFDCRIIPYNDYFSLGKLNFTHGEKHNKYHSASHLDIYMKSIMYGHLHTKQVYTRITKGNEPHQGICVPAACNTNPDYMKGRASTWINGFALIYWINHIFYYNVVQIIKGQTVVNGKIYK